MSTNLVHIPVAVKRCIDLLSPALNNKKNPILLDATLGLGGHAKLFLEQFSNLKLIGFDRDQIALDTAKVNLSQYLPQISFIHSTYDQIQEELARDGVDFADAILFDLGVSSMQLDQIERGFSYSQAAPLDMRMDQSSPLTAAIILETYTHGELAKLLQNYGEEKFASKIAENIIKARAKSTLKSTKDLAELVKDSIPAPARRSGGNPAKRTFQALRIEVNQELVILEKAIPAALGALAVGGRLVVMSYQSLEDRIVKRHFNRVCASKSPLQLPVELPDSAASYKLLISGSQGADDLEQISNPRSQSMRLRAIERVAI